MRGYMTGHIFVHILRHVYKYDASYIHTYYIYIKDKLVDHFIYISTEKSRPEYI